MVLFPDVMHKAQAELDNVIGRSRLPKASDRDKLPYTSALVREVRFHAPFIILKLIDVIDFTMAKYW